MTDADTVRVTYAELARARGVSMAAARRLAQRHRWPKQVGNDGLSHVLIPATYLARPEPDGDDVATDIAGDVTTDIVGDVASDITNGVAADGEDLQVLSFDEVIAAFTDVAHDIANRVANDVAGNIIPILREQLAAERERADRAEDRAQVAKARIQELTEQLTAEQILRTENKDRLNHTEQLAKDAELRAEQIEAQVQTAEGRVRELTEQLNAEMVEHRQIVGRLTEQLAARRSWWPWRRKS